METNIEEVKSYFKQIKSNIEKRNELEENILKEFDSDIFNIDYLGIYSRIENDYNTNFFTRLFIPLLDQYRKDRKTIIFKYREIPDNISYKQMIGIVKKLKEHTDYKNWYTVNIQKNL